MGLSLTRVSKGSEFFASTVPASDSVDFDVIDFDDTASKLYVCEFSSAANDLYKSLQLFASREGTDVTDTVFSILGNSLQVSVQFLKDGTETKLRVTNSEAFPVLANIQRLAVR
jgi:hypothetical protein